MTHFWCEKHEQAHVKGKDGKECLLVGPFPSKQEAEEWANPEDKQECPIHGKIVDGNFCPRC